MLDVKQVVMQMNSLIDNLNLAFPQATAKISLQDCQSRLLVNDDAPNVPAKQVRKTDYLKLADEICSSLHSAHS